MPYFKWQSTGGHLIFAQNIRKVPPKKHEITIKENWYLHPMLGSPHQGLNLQARACQSDPSAWVLALLVTPLRPHTMVTSVFRAETLPCCLEVKTRQNMCIFFRRGHRAVIGTSWSQLPHLCASTWQVMMLRACATASTFVSESLGRTLWLFLWSSSVLSSITGKLMEWRLYPRTPD